MPVVDSWALFFKSCPVEAYVDGRWNPQLEPMQRTLWARPCARPRALKASSRGQPTKVAAAVLRTSPAWLSGAWQGCAVCGSLNFFAFWQPWLSQFSPLNSAFWRIPHRPNLAETVAAMNARSCAACERAKQESKEWSSRANTRLKKDEATHSLIEKQALATYASISLLKCHCWCPFASMRR